MTASSSDGGLELAAAYSPSPLSELIDVLLENRPTTDAEVDMHETARDVAASHEGSSELTLSTLKAYQKLGVTSRECPAALAAPAA